MRADYDSIFLPPLRRRYNPTMSAQQSPDERRFRIVGVCRDGERLIFAEGLEIVEAYARRRALLAERGLPRIVVELQRSEGR